ncbi:MAG TPA: DUF3667 domain-containing protein [Polyangiaceae bacterium]
MPSGHKPHVDHCLNCAEPTPGAYCASCGQEAVSAHIRFREQIADFLGEILSFEARLPQTIRVLFTHPGELTRAYNAGQRVRYVTPLKTYLFTSFVFFVVLSLSPHESSPVSDSAGLRDMLDAPNHGGIPALLVPHLESLLKSPEGFTAALFDAISKATVALVPIHAALLKLVYLRKKRLYGEHIVFSLHAHAFGYVAYTLSNLSDFVPSHDFASLMGVAAFVSTWGYTVLAARRVYAEGLFRAFVKSCVVGLGYLVGLTLVLSLAATVVFFRT